MSVHQYILNIFNMHLNINYILILRIICFLNSTDKMKREAQIKFQCGQKIIKRRTKINLNIFSNKISYF